MDVDFNADVPELRRQSATRRKMAADLVAEADALDDVAKAKEKLARIKTGQTESKGQKVIRTLVDVAEAISLSNVITQVMRESAGRVWTADELLEYMTERRLYASQSKTPRNSIAATLSRMRAHGIVEHAGGAGRYRLAAPQQASSPVGPGDDVTARQGELERGNP